MAMKKTVTTAQGFEANDAYHRVENVVLTSKDKMSFRIRSYKDASGLPAFADEGFECDYNINGSNPIAQAYVFAKASEKFQDSLDC